MARYDSDDERINIAKAMRVHGRDALSDVELSRYAALESERIHGQVVKRVGHWYQLDCAKWAWNGNKGLENR